jgi:hypothetical protein
MSVETNAFSKVILFRLNPRTHLFSVLIHDKFCDFHKLFYFIYLIEKLPHLILYMNFDITRFEIYLHSMQVG